MKNDKKFKGVKKRQIRLNKKRAYIALAVLLVIISFSFSLRKSVEHTLTDESSVDRALFDEAKEEVINTEIKINENKEEKKSLDVSLNNQEVAYASTEEDLKFIYPAKGEILKEYSKGDLVYFETMEDYRTHNGIDFKGDEGSQVLAVADGVVDKVYKDDMLGIVVEILHNGNIKSIYCGLQSLDFISPKKAVKKGDIIGGIGKAGALEEDMGSHLHFEVLKMDEYQDPKLYFSN